LKTEEFIMKYSSELQPVYKRMALQIQELLTSILADNNITPHSTTCREKDPESLRLKIGKEGKSYNDPLDEITDLAGVRIITYFPSEVDKIIPIIEKEFKIDKKNSIDKRKTSDPTVFGYVSVHLIVEFSSDRIKLPEYSRYKGMKCEIQVRTILQHAWAEIEHDIVYKSSEDIPFELRRKFASLSGLLEIADREFETLRQDEIKIRKEIHETINRDNIDIPIDLDSLRFYFEKYHNEKKIGSFVLSKLNKFVQSKNITTIEQLHKILTVSALANVSNDVLTFSKLCHSTNRCFIKYFFVLGDYFKLSRHEMGTLIDCPAMEDEARYKMKRKVFEEKKPEKNHE